MENESTNSQPQELEPLPAIEASWSWLVQPPDLEVIIVGPDGISYHASNVNSHLDQIRDKHGSECVVQVIHEIINNHSNVHTLLTFIHYRSSGT